VSSAVAQLPVLDLDLRITVGESALRGNRFVGYNLYNRGESVALDRSALVEAGGGREPPRDASGTAIGRDKLPDIPGEDRCPEACLRVETARFERRCLQNSAMIGSN
jgi:hypothetical protein